MIERHFSELKDERIANLIDISILEWQRSLNEALVSGNPFDSNRLKLIKAKESLNSDETNKSTLKEAIDGYKELSQISVSPINTEYWDGELTHINSKEIRLSQHLLIENWEKNLTRESVDWEIEKIEDERKDIVDQIDGWFDIVRSSREVMRDPSDNTGIFLDFSLGQLEKQDLDNIRKIVESLSKSSELQRLCELMGSVCSYDNPRYQTNKVLSDDFDVSYKDISSKEEILGVEIGNQIEHAIPQELALIRDDSVSILFDKKYVENQLMCFSLEGINYISESQSDYLYEDITNKMGPMILCVDTSGSMKGMPETVAKALTLYLASKTRKEKRDCFLINFSTSIDTIEINSDTGIEKLMEFLSLSFNGGTDIEIAINTAINKLNTKEYEKADVLIISDFIIQELSNKLKHSMSSIKKKNNHFYSIAVTKNLLETKSVKDFDQSWCYDSNKMVITEITNDKNIKD